LGLYTNPIRFGKLYSLGEVRNPKYAHVADVYLLLVLLKNSLYGLRPTYIEQKTPTEDYTIHSYIIHPK